MQPLIEKRQKREKRLSPDELVKAAQTILSAEDACLLVCDIVESGKFTGFSSLLEQQQYFVGALTAAVGRYGNSFPENRLRNFHEEDRGFVVVAGDGAIAAINNAAVIPEILRFLGEHYPKLKLRWSVAKDGLDRQGLSIIH